MIPFNYKYFVESQKILIEMLQDRGYKMIKNMIETEPEFHKHLEEQGGIIRIEASSLKKTVIVIWFSSTTSIGVEEVKKVVYEFLEHDAENKKAFFIINTKLTPSSKQIIEGEPSIETFTFSEMQYNPTKHSLVPKHEALTKQKKLKLLETIPEPKLYPKILSSDRITRWYGWKKGTIVKVSKKGSGDFITYRVVC